MLGYGNQISPVAVTYNKFEPDQKFSAYFASPDIIDRPCNHYLRAIMGEYLKARFRDVVRTAHEIGMQLDLYFCSPMKKEIDEGSVDMRGKYEETMEFIGKASPVSLAG